MALNCVELRNCAAVPVPMARNCCAVLGLEKNPFDKHLFHYYIIPMFSIHSADSRAMDSPLRTLWQQHKEAATLLQRGASARAVAGALGISEEMALSISSSRIWNCCAVPRRGRGYERAEG